MAFARSMHPAHPQLETHDQRHRYSDSENYERNATDDAEENEKLADGADGARERAKQLDLWNLAESCGERRAGQRPASSAGSARIHGLRLRCCWGTRPAGATVSPAAAPLAARSAVDAAYAATLDNRVALQR